MRSGLHDSARRIPFDGTNHLVEDGHPRRYCVLSPARDRPPSESRQKRVRVFKEAKSGAS